MFVIAPSPHHQVSHRICRFRASQIHAVSGQLKRHPLVDPRYYSQISDCVTLVLACALSRQEEHLHAPFCYERSRR